MDNVHRTHKMANGFIVQSGVPSGSRQDIEWPSTGGYIARAVVLKTYYSDDSEWANRAGGGDDVSLVACDVRTYGKRQRTLFRVPVLQRACGMHDQDVYIPRDSTINITGGQLTTAPGGQKVTEAENMDGDHVLIGFLESDPAQPVILPYAFPHPSTQRRLNETNGRVRKIRHNGTLVEWDEAGNLTIDATEAAKAQLNQDGTEDPSKGTGGKITIKTKSGSDKLTSIHLTETGQVHLGSDPDVAPTSPIVCGTEWIDLMGRFIDGILALTVGTPIGPSSTPVNFQTFIDLKTEIDAKTQVSDFIFTKKSLD